MSTMPYPDSEILVPKSLEPLLSDKWEGMNDEVGKPVKFDHAFAVTTHREIRDVIEYARQNECIVKAIGAGTSSGSFDKPDREWMEEHGKRGVLLVEFPNRPGSDFSDITIDEEQEKVIVGAAVSLQSLSDAVSEQTDKRFENPMSITTMSAGVVSTFVGSGGVSDHCRDMSSLLVGASYINGEGLFIHENHKPGTYFDYSSFNYVRPFNVTKDMSGRGGPFGVGLTTSSLLERAPVDRHHFVLNFLKGNRDKFEVHRDFLETIVRMNKLAIEFPDDAPFKPVGMEIMDENAIAVARRFGPDGGFVEEGTQIALMLEFAQKKGKKGMEALDVWEQLLEWGLVEGRFFEEETRYDVAPLEGTRELDAFRLAGPDGARHLIKNGFSQRAFSASTDYAVAAWEEDMVLDYGMRLYGLQQSFLEEAKRRGKEAYAVGYGHGSWRYDPHVRVITEDRELFDQFVEGKFELGQRVLDWQKNGRLARLRGEKPEQPGGLDYQLIAGNRVSSHVEANRRVLEWADPDGVFMHRAPERWRS